MPKTRPCPDQCNVLLIGSGGREHALAWKLSQSPRLGTLWSTGTVNAGIAALARTCDQPMDMSNTFQMVRWCEKNAIDLVIVGPEQPLADGITDVLQSKARYVFGPSKEGAQLEADKVFSKKLMRQASIPTADSRSFITAEDAQAYVEAHDEPCVIKATGLAAGKGVIICKDGSQASHAVNQIMVDRQFGDAGASIIIEERLEGQEVSVLALYDGRTLWILDPCQDHKPVGEGDTGPNTGGMGAYCPTPVIDVATMQLVEREVFVPLVDALRRSEIDYRGVIYAGLMLTPGGPKVLEFNARFGDPECQPLMMRLKSDLIELLWATCTGGLDEFNVKFDPRTACCVVMCSSGYPGDYRKGLPITGVEDVKSLVGDNEELQVFHAGTSKNNSGTLITNGGRVLGVTALAADLARARELANAACDHIHFEGRFYRKDIGGRVIGLCAT